VVGSSTAYPIIASAAEHFGQNSEFKTPVVESTGTGGGFKLFCSGLGLTSPDIVMASRRMKETERKACENHGVTDIREIKIGFDGVVFASRIDAPDFALTRHDIYLALVRSVPSTTSPNSLVTNPYKTWSQIRSALPDQPIRVYGPPPTSGTRDILVERLLTDACLAEPVLRELFAEDHFSFLKQCHTLREDGAFINAGENDARLVRKLFDNPHAMSIFGFSFLDQNSDRLKAASIDGIRPVFESIESGDYPLTRPLYVYVKSAHESAVVGLGRFIETIIAEDSIGPDGRLIDKGLIPLAGR
jgi:phosphate transport system substrate-binding protein